MQHLWPHVPLIHCLARADGEGFSGQVDSYSHVIVKGQRYDAVWRKSGLHPRFAFIDAREPVEILNLCAYTHKRKQSHLNPESCVFAIVRRLIKDATVPTMPWDERYASVFLRDNFIRSCIVLSLALLQSLRSWDEYLVF